jgi:hypothetical protein
VDYNALRDPFESEAVEWKVIESKLYDGKPYVYVAPFVDARAIMERLDLVVGPGNWMTDVKAAPNSLDGVIYGLSLRVNGEWVTKYDGADIMPTASVRQADRTKSALTMGLRRAAMVWGIGRYLWALPKHQKALTNESRSDRFPNYHAIKPPRGQTGPNVVVYWRPPDLPAWARPADLRVRVVKDDAAPESATKARVVETTVSGEVAVPLCPLCTARMWDNRAENEKKNALLREAGQKGKRYPDFRCRDGNCGASIYPNEYDPVTLCVTPAAQSRLENNPF